MDALMVTRYSSQYGGPKTYDASVWDEHQSVSKTFDSPGEVGDWIKTQASEMGGELVSVSFIETCYQDRITNHPPQPGDICPACTKPIQEGEMVMRTATISPRKFTAWYHADC